MGFMELAKERYTVRKYADKPLEKEQLDKLLECLLIAPTAKNLQPVRVYVIEGEKNLAKLDELTKCRYGPRACWRLPTTRTRTGRTRSRAASILESRT